MNELSEPSVWLLARRRARQSALVESQAFLITLLIKKLFVRYEGGAFAFTEIVHPLLSSGWRWIALAFCGVE